MRKRAFTLIELLVVIAIIALLVSILMPSLSKAKELAKTAACLSDLKGVASAFAQYQGEYSGFYPQAFGSGGDCDRYAQEASGLDNAAWAANQGQFGSGRGGRNWAVALWPYYKNLQLFTCPSDPAANSTSKDRNYSGHATPGPVESYEAYVGAPRQSYYVNAAMFRGWGWKSPLWTSKQVDLLTKSASPITVEALLAAHNQSAAALYWVGENGAGRSTPQGCPVPPYWNGDPYSANWGGSYGTYGGFRNNALAWPAQFDNRFPDGATATWEMHPRAANGGYWGSDSPDGGSNYLWVDGHATNQRGMPNVQESGCAAGG